MCYKWRWTYFSGLTMLKFINQHKFTLFSATAYTNFYHFSHQVEHLHFPSVSCQRRACKRYIICVMSNTVQTRSWIFCYWIYMDIYITSGRSFWLVYFEYCFSLFFLCFSRFKWQDPSPILVLKGSVLYFQQGHMNIVQKLT